MVADVPVGAFLSGGIDSAAVVAMMARHSARPVHTFTIGVPDAPRYDETNAAQQVAAMYGTDHHEFGISRNDLIEAVPAVLAGMDEPFADSSAIPTYIVSRETSRHVKVALSGDGGDELFAGYRSYLSEYWRVRYAMIPGLLRDWIIRPVVEALPDSRETRIGDTVRQAKKFVRAAAGGEDERLLRLREIFPASVREGILKPGNGGPDPALCWVRGLLARVSGDGINRMLCTDIVDSLPGDMLTKVDLMSMRHSLEVRVPMLDHRLVEMALQVPGSVKLRGGVTKRVMRDAFAPFLPPGFTRRPKRGFEIPIAEWLRTDLSRLVREFLGEERIRDEGIFEFDTVSRLVEDHRSRRADTSWMLWNLIVFEKWHDAFCE
jgi:asparagine synthase (glutamine-hydrolysing)